MPEPTGVELVPYRDKAFHLLEYGVLGLLLLIAIRRSRGPLGWPPAFTDPHVAVAFASIYGFTDELHQSFVPLRQTDVVDLVFDVFGAFLFVFAFSAHIPPSPLPLSPNAKSVELPEGRLAYAEAGKGPTLVYLHGWHASRRYFEDAPVFLPGYRHIAFDLFGFGESDAPARFSYAPCDQARVVREAARRLGIADAILVGHSMGGAVALALALDDPEFVRALVLVEPSVVLGIPGPGVLTQRDARALGLGLARHFLGTNPRPFMHLVVEQPEAFSKAFEADFLRVPHHASSRSIRAMARADLARRLPEVKSPTLLVFGDPSHVVRAAYGNAMMAKLPRSRLVHIAGTSHCPMIEAPASFYGAVREFLDVDLNGRVAKPPAATYTSP